MKKYLGILPLLISSVFVTTAQTNFSTDSLQRLLTQARHDTSRILLLTQLSIKYRFFNPDSAMVLAQQALRLADGLNFPYGKVRCLNNYGEIMRFRGDFPQSLEIQLQALQLSKSTHNLEGEEASLGDIGTVYSDLDEYRQALSYLFQAKAINENRLDKYAGGRWLATIGSTYEKMNRLDSALFFLQQAENLVSPFPSSNSGTLIAIRLGIVHYRLQHPDLSLHYFEDAIKSSYTTNDIVNRSRAQYRLAELYHSLDKPDSSLHYCRLAFANGNIVFLKTTILDASKLLATLHKEKNNFDSAFYYQEAAMAINDSLYGREKFQQLQVLTLTQQQQQQQLREKQVQLQHAILISAVAIFLVIALVLWRNIRYQKRTNETLNIKNEQIETQRNTLEEMLTELKSTQSQLIQSEKMASLGELTAGIAHEIQNPLNFVNNFSDVNRELLAEMKDEMDKGNIADAKEIANDVFANEEKINHHGKRADAIVKGMLQHSQSSSGIREPTDINKLADEYLRLSYHGLRAKDKSFNATMKTDFDN
ncbi:MAG: tetratricopeptide repeat protein, partial [Bacteroidetes bacterium]